MVNTSSDNRLIGLFLVGLIICIPMWANGQLSTSIQLQVVTDTLFIDPDYVDMKEPKEEFLKIRILNNTELPVFLPGFKSLAYIVDRSDWCNDSLGKGISICNFYDSTRQATDVILHYNKVPYWDINTTERDIKNHINQSKVNHFRNSVLVGPHESLIVRIPVRYNSFTDPFNYNKGLYYVVLRYRSGSPKSDLIGKVLNEQYGSVNFKGCLSTEMIPVKLR